MPSGFPRHILFSGSWSGGAVPVRVPPTSSVFTNSPHASAETLSTRISPRPRFLPLLDLRPEVARIPPQIAASGTPASFFLLIFLKTAAPAMVCLQLPSRTLRRTNSRAVRARSVSAPPSPPATLLLFCAAASLSGQPMPRPPFFLTFPRWFFVRCGPCALKSSEHILFPCRPFPTKQAPRHFHPVVWRSSRHGRRCPS